MAAPSVFISYAHADRAQKDEIVKHLEALNLRMEVTPWSDEDIRVGDDYREQIDVALTAASVSILLISVDALTSKFIRDTELPALLHRRRTEGMLLIPVLIRPCAWKQVGWLESLQLENAIPLSQMAVPEREQACVHMAERVLQHLVVAGDDRPSQTSSDARVAGGETTSIPAGPRNNPLHVDREEDLQAFLNLFDPSTDDQVIVVSASPSMGKTWFVRKCAAFKPAGSTLATVDFKQLGYGVSEIIQHIADSFDYGGRFPNLTNQFRELTAGNGGANSAAETTQLLERQLTKMLVEEARMSRRPGSFDLMVFDSLEYAPAQVRNWVSYALVGWVIKDKGLVLVVAGTDAEDVGQSHTVGVVHRTLTPLALADAAKLAVAYELDLSLEEVQRYHDFTRGNPLALASGFQNLRVGGGDVRGSRS